MKFTKMQGIGNDYIYVNCFQEKIENPSALSVRLSDRHFGIGADGLILIAPSKTADFKMEIYNADGSRAGMCGNGIRCVGKYVYDYGLTDKTQISVETDSGIRKLELHTENGKVKSVRVNMGMPILEPCRIPVSLPEGEDSGEAIIGRPITVDGRQYVMSCVSMGNPHAVVPVEELDSLEIEKIGPAFERHPFFPDRVNTEFITVKDRTVILMRVWERGSGETYACGTGACAAAVACILNGWTEDSVTVKLRGGDLEIFWDREENTVYMTGPVALVFEGEIVL